ncbi:histidine utilization repressor [Gallaecimonas xiamenensis]|uniref:Histidine utilization repressor n=1 Tax=Gallaecimonas xiamenensis 3-C-1 TaxID=745411 RepID=K2IBK5_9GAMM|nr:histidine utilization repressor [Gallaecimonas xiamenensis]EKE67261.1 histidine utilization repressor [Gallaecimonas xiamenensis 3-C-1]
MSKFVPIRQWLLDSIDAGNLGPGDAVPSENQLAERFGVSRMTARRALTELVDNGMLERRQGQGTFVAELKAQSALLTIRNIADEIAGRGHHYQAEVVSLKALPCPADVAKLLGLSPGSQVGYSKILHAENSAPIQLEERYVNLELAPAYLAQDFEQHTPHEYLSAVAPLTAAHHWVEAVAADPAQAGLLDVAEHSPLLKLTRLTASRQGAVSLARLYHPSHYRLGGQIPMTLGESL